MAVTFEIPLNHKSGEIYAFPREIELGRIAGSKIADRKFQFTIVLPSDVIPDDRFEVVAHTESKRLVIGPRTRVVSEVPAGSQTRTYQRLRQCSCDLTLPNGFSGELDEQITLDVVRDDHILKSLNVAIRGDVLPN